MNTQLHYGCSLKVAKVDTVTASAHASGAGSIKDHTKTIRSRAVVLDVSLKGRRPAPLPVVNVDVVVVPVEGDSVRRTGRALNKQRFR